MSPEEREPAIRRILVALDASPASLTALETAAQLAAELGAELLGVFVEDVNLLRLGELSFSQEVGLYSTRRRQLDTAQLERQLRAQAGQARRALEVIAGRSGVNWSFRVMRGVIAVEVLTVAVEADLVTLGRVGWSPLGRRGLGSTAQSILLQAPRPALMVRPGTRLGQPALVLYDGSPAGQRALVTAGQLLRGRTPPGADRPVTVVILAEEPAEALQLQEEAAAQLDRPGVALRYRWQIGTGVEPLLRAIRAEGCQVIVLPADSPRLDPETLLALVRQIECPVVLVR